MLILLQISLTIQMSSKVNSNNNVEYFTSKIVHITRSTMNFSNNQEYHVMLTFGFVKVTKGYVKEKRQSRNPAFFLEKS